jgi:hypothetical protein
MNLIIRETAWAIISENAIIWHEDYRKDMKFGKGHKRSVDMLYSNRCNDQVNHILRFPVPLDETIILLDRFWARECDAAKTDEFKARVKEVASRYDEIVFEREGMPCSGKGVGKLDIETKSTDTIPIDKSRKEFYAYGSNIEIMSRYLLRLAILDDSSENAICRILLDPTQARKLHDTLGDILGEYERNFGEIGDGSPTAPKVARRSHDSDHVIV